MATNLQVRYWNGISLADILNAAGMIHKEDRGVGPIPMIQAWSCDVTRRLSHPLADYSLGV